MTPLGGAVQLVRFRDDLRTHEHSALAVAASRGPVAALAVLDPDRFRPVDHDFPRQGAFFARFRLEARADLRARLRARGGDLVVRRGRAEDVVPEAAAAVGARAVHVTMMPCSEEQAEERRVGRALERLADAPRLERHAGATLVDPDAVPAPDGRPPRVFTKFRRLVEKKIAIEAAIPPPNEIVPAAGLEAGAMPTLEDLELSDPPEDERGVRLFRGGESAGLERLHGWICEGDRLRHDTETRNGLLGAAYSWKLSPWLAHDGLGPRTVHAAVRRYEEERVRNDSTHWLVVELPWRDFFHHGARDAGARLFRAGGLRGLRLPWSRDEERFAA